MSQPSHPVEREEVMAYLDGELPLGRASAVATHLEQCAECQAAASDMRLVSRQLATWQVEPAPARLTDGITAALQASAKDSTARQPKGATAAPEKRRRLVPVWAWAVAGGLASLLLIVAISIPNLLRSRMAVNQASRRAPLGGNEAAVGTIGKLQENRSLPTNTLPSGPMIIHTASLSMVAKDFDATRAAIEGIIRRHQGYAAQVTVTGYAGSPRTLTGSFRVPADQLGPILSEIKPLGQVVQESQSGEEVTQQYVDLVARLSNAHVTEQRLVEILNTRTGKVPDVLAVEREIARVREEIERMEAQRKSLENRVQFAALQIQLNEEYQAQAEVSAPSTGRRLRNAVVDGYRNLLEGALDLTEFAFRYGPAIGFWLVVFFWPARWAWRRVRARRR